MKKELRVIKEEELEGDLLEIMDFLGEIRESAMELGYTSIELERYYGDEDGYLQVTGVKTLDMDRFDMAFWDTVADYDDEID